MNRLLVLPLLVLIGCGGGENRVATEPEPVGEEDYIHDPRAPRLRLEEADRASIRVPDLPADARLWTTAIPVGTDEARRPAILVATNERGKLIGRKVWVDPSGSGDFTAAEPWTLAPYHDYEGWFETDPIVTLRYPVGTETGQAVFRALVNVYPGGAGARLQPAGGRAGTFPGTETRFLLYDGDRSGTYDPADPLVIDANGDGTFDGNRNSVELYTMEEPFLLDGLGYRIGTVAWDGSSVTVIRTNEPIEERVPLVAGAPAPDFTLHDLDGNEVCFSEVSSGRPVLLAYWATW
ncbi:MAG: hypothetical protein ABIK65_13875 [Candidatus Eisenbacteria bacterium]